MKNQRLKMIGDRNWKSNFDPDLARRINEETEREERRDELKRKRKPKPSESHELESQHTETTPSQLEIRNPETYILLEGREHKSDTGTYQYPDFWVSMHRLGMSEQIEAIREELGFEVANTAKERDGTDYIGNINWQEALKLNLMLGGRTLTPRQGIDFLMDLQDGIEGKKRIYDGNGRQVTIPVLRKIYNEITEARAPYRAEWLDADFKVKDELHIKYEHELKNGILVPKKSEPLESYLDARGVKVSFADFNRQGLATKADENGQLYHWKPLNYDISVAGTQCGFRWVRPVLQRGSIWSRRFARGTFCERLVRGAKQRADFCNLSLL